MAGAPKGNSNASKKNRVMTDALRRELAQYEASGIKRGEAASAIAKKLIGMAIEGDRSAIGEIYDRLDGKPQQSVDMNINDERTDRDSILTELAAIHARIAERSDGRGTDADSGAVPPSSTTH